MRGLLLESILFANLFIPIWAARESSRRRGIQKAIVTMVIFDALYATALRYAFWFIN
jgi:hypothetical protein